MVEASGAFAGAPGIALLAVVILLALFVLGRLGRARRRARRRRMNDDVQTWAASHGYRYDARDDSVDPGWTVPPFRGEDMAVPGTGTCRNVVRGNEGGRPFVTFEYVRRKVGGRDLGKYQYQRTSVVAVPTPGVTPTVGIRGHSGASAVLSAMTGDSVFHEAGRMALGDKAFDNRFEVVPADRDVARRLLSPAVRAALLSTPIGQRQNAAASATGFRIVLDQGWALVIEGVEDPETRLREGLAAIAAVLDNAPRDVWSPAPAPNVTGSS